MSVMNTEHEKLVHKLKDDSFHKEYEEKYHDYKVGFIPLVLGKFLVFAGDLIYGKEPSYGKFQAIEVIARVPYESWEMVSYLFLTALYSNEKRAINLTHTSRFGRMAQDNETMHVVVISKLAKEAKQTGLIRFYLIPLIFSLFYFIASTILYIVSRKSSLELNYMFESHAYEQYGQFIDENKEELKNKPVNSRFLDFYGRPCANQYEFFVSVRNDELIHRNESLERIKVPRA